VALHTPRDEPCSLGSVRSHLRPRKNITYSIVWLSQHPPEGIRHEVDDGQDIQDCGLGASPRSRGDGQLMVTADQQAVHPLWVVFVGSRSRTTHLLTADRVSHHLAHRRMVGSSSSPRPW
jgi:hypothetical protein